MMRSENKTVRTLVGCIVSDKMQKTVTVLVERRVAHPVIGKVVRRSMKYHAHCDGAGYKTGDLVTIQECRPISKTKSWVVTGLVQGSREV
ncbi:MAG TPA: 30S ribosomal protein S17 [Burkholderiales bacterium]|nr:30S ribosomal protein S17 [Burkholderiales bacterium]